MRIERHPSGVWVREDGCVYLPQSGKNPAHWTFGNECGRGYMYIQFNGKKYLVHRLVAEAFIGPIPDGMEIDHISRNREDNAVNNIRIVTSSINHRNTSTHDRIDARGGTHWYDNEKQYRKEWHTKYFKTHKNVRFSDGKCRPIPNEQALELLKLPVKERIYDKI